MSELGKTCLEKGTFEGRFIKKKAKLLLKCCFNEFLGKNLRSKVDGGIYDKNGNQTIGLHATLAKS